MTLSTNSQILLFTNDDTANNVSDGFSRDTFCKHFVQVTCSGTAVAVDIEFSADGVNWLDSGITITGNDYIEIDMFVPYMRAVRDNTTNPVTVKIYSGWYMG
jgi:hypothetical protein